IAQVKERILNGTRCLLQGGTKMGFLHPSLGEDEYQSKAAVGVINSGLTELCEMAKQLPLVNEDLQPSVQVITKETSSAPDLDLFTCVTENSMNYARTLTLMGRKYLIPPLSSFLLSDVSCMEPLLNYNKKYDIIILDPPWENKSVKRSSRYSFLHHWEIKQIPVPALMAPGCLIVIWVTNRQKHLRFVKEELYPHWSVEVLAEWHWVKITKSGEFVFPLESPHRKPYEILVLGRVKETSESLKRKSEVESVPVPDHKLIVSIPSILHSHKPPLTEILAEYVKPEAKGLELFARSLQPGWTSWGNEVLKFQEVDYFTAMNTK
uniref:Methyltransferase 4, N6-adenosine n=1 Tax=Latimeria chalumnae TaxID=7897 RepID=H3B619_LATCH